MTPTADLTVSYATSDGTATAGTDYTAVSGTLTFTATNAGAQTFTVETTGDSIEEGSGEDFSVSISSPAGGGGPAPALGTAKQVTTTITDDDTRTPVEDPPDDPSGVLPPPQPPVEEPTQPPANSPPPPPAGSPPPQPRVRVAEVSITGPAASVAEGSAAEFTVTLSEQVAAQVVVAWSAPLGTDAAQGADLSATSGTVTFAANSVAGATQTITITAADDKLSEGAEGFTVTLGTITSTLSEQVSLKDGASAAQATIAASDPITVTITGPSSVDEGEATADYTVALSPSGVRPTADLTVSYATSDGTAKAGADYTATSGTLTFTTANAGAQTFTVQTTEDSIDEGSGEDFSVAISSPAGGGGPAPTLGSATTVTTTITDDDTPSDISLSVNPSTLGEDADATAVTVTATLAGATHHEDIVVTLALGGTATEDTDYAATAPGTITIAANTASGTASFTVTPADDTIVEGDETIVVSGTASVTSLSVSDAILTLTDVQELLLAPGWDSAELSISGPSSEVAEGSAAGFTVTLSRQVAAEVAVAWSAPLDTDAADAADLSATSGTVTFPANSAAGSTRTITITATDDQLSEDAESFTVTLGEITSTLSSQISLKNGAKAARATIAASDPITVTLTGPSSVDEGEATADYTVALSPSGVKPTTALTVSYRTADGTASAGTDYTAASGTLTFTATHAGAQTFTVQTTEDSIDEGSGEDFSVAISTTAGSAGPTAAQVATTATAAAQVATTMTAGAQVVTTMTATTAQVATTATVTTTITDDDAPSDITLSVNPSTLGEDDEPTLVTVTATLEGGTHHEDIVVTLALGGTATEDTDYSATSPGTITISANTASGTASFTVTPVDDSVVEGDETIVVSGTASVTSLSVSDAILTLTDGVDSPHAPGRGDSAELSISGPTGEVTEGSAAGFTVTLSEQVDAEVAVAWSAPLDTDAADAADLSATSGTVTFAANSAAGATQTITITAVDDRLSEGAEGFTVTLGAITSTLSEQVSLRNGASAAQATIAASDPITVTITGPASVDEGEATADYTVALSPEGVTPTADLTVSYRTADGTATAGTDYTAASGTLTFTATDAGAQTFTVQTAEDSIDEGAGEDFSVAISSPAGGGGPAPSLGSATTVTTTITDDDAPSDITLSVNPSTLGEADGATPVAITATLEGATHSEDIVVTLTLGGAADESDYTASALTTITIEANAASGTGSVTITPIDDAVVEGDEAIIFSGAASITGLSVSDAVLTLTDGDDSPHAPGRGDSAELSISGPTGEVTEGSAAGFTVTLSEQVDAEVAVAWSAPLDTDAADAADLSATSGTVTFAANSAAGATQTITITAVDDRLSEGAEGFTVTLGAITSTLSEQVSLMNGASAARATIAASDPITVTITGPASVDEGEATADYTVALSPEGVTPTADLTVRYATSDGTAAAGEDYTAAAGTLTFTATNAGAQTFTVQTTQDDVDEGAGEDFSVAISSPARGGGAPPALGATTTVTTTITDDDEPGASESPPRAGDGDPDQPGNGGPGDGDAPGTPGTPPRTTDGDADPSADGGAPGDNAPGDGASRTSPASTRAGSGDDGSQAGGDADDAPPPPPRAGSAGLVPSADDDGAPGASQWVLLLLALTFAAVMRMRTRRSPGRPGRSAAGTGGSYGPP